MLNIPILVKAKKMRLKPMKIEVIVFFFIYKAKK